MTVKLNVVTAVSLCIVFVSVAGCLDTGSSNSAFTVSGIVNGVVGQGLVLQNNGGNDLSVAANGSFTFTNAIASGDAYAVQVLAQPTGPNQTCSVANGSGTIANANVSNIEVTCTTNTYAVGGTITGIVGSGLVLQNNTTDNLSLISDGDFVFTNSVTSGNSYSVTVLTQPSNPSQTCTVHNGTGIGDATDIVDVFVTCVMNYTIGGTASGIPTIGITLRNNGGDEISLNANGAFTFSTPIPSGSSYDISWSGTAPDNSALNCEIVNDSGNVADVDITNVQLNCMYISVAISLKQLSFSWAAVSNATYYRLFENPDGTAGFQQIGGDIIGTGTVVDVAVHRLTWPNALFSFQACNNSGCGPSSGTVNIVGKADAATGFLKASNDEPNDRFGGIVAISADGSTMATVTVNVVVA